MFGTREFQLIRVVEVRCSADAVKTSQGSGSFRTNLLEGSGVSDPGALLSPSIE